MSGDLTAFVTARLDEDEAIAKAAASEAGPDWTWDRESRDGYLRTPAGTIMADALNVEDEQFRPHVARHDPARALREVAAKRKRLALMIEATAEMDKLLADEHAGDVARAMAIGRARAATVGVKIDAEIWHDHPDYNPDWST